MKKVLVICGTGVATSTMVASSIKEHCAAQGIDVQVTQGKVMDLLGSTPDVDVIVATTAVPDGITVPVVPGLPFLTGMGRDQALADVVSHLQ
ncbi:PTS sugar transporter subunit IIB [Nocardioides sp. cx-173]|uniref:PTS sugar transporter subunit IIB n=1 Tax=Nocardioides sp. cx-173 TaxID=2898796 RepID=UPI001E5C89BD|nr:PTS sugar transporter subunit IIB [Nocardioides sp. cx-173]MCD4526512.1 PTS sugar transporter subunit IIB [Nocardioides sp. cx-173]UGB41199.1 PTS sugar transporter subunit IIB [Nocardioides sp. cx-173]